MLQQWFLEKNLHVKFLNNVRPEIPTAGSGVWIPNSGSKYHRYSSCSNMRNPRNVSENQAISMGYTPCKKCY